MNPSHLFRGRRTPRWAHRLLAMSVPVAAVVASCGGDDSNLFGPAGSGGGSTTSSTSSSAGGATGVTTGAAGNGGATTGSTTSTTNTGGTTNAGGSTGTAGHGGSSGAPDAGGDVSTGGGGAGDAGAGGGGRGGGGRDASTDGPCIAGEGEKCGGFIAGACRCADGLICRTSGLPDAPGTCVKPDAGAPRSCLPTCNRCTTGVCCGVTGCCGPGEWCDESGLLPTCKCGNQTACLMPSTCHALGPASENGCGSVCCSQNCPQ